VKIIRELLDEMFEECWKCDASGWTPLADPPPTRPNMPRTRQQRCADCSGTGEVLTEDGQALFDKLLPYLRREFPVHEHEHGV
jgi:hypothetical protein